MTEKEFKDLKLWGMSLSLDLYNCDAKTIRSAEDIKTYVKLLCELIEMKTFGETHVVHFGEDPKVCGFSMTQLIETSLISGHFANNTNAAYLDIFSCKYYKPQTVVSFSKEFFKASSYKYSLAKRQ